MAEGLEGARNVVRKTSGNTSEAGKRENTLAFFFELYNHFDCTLSIYKVLPVNSVLHTQDTPRRTHRGITTATIL